MCVSICPISGRQGVLTGTDKVPDFFQKKDKEGA
jgi:hypothetical protein